MLVCQTNPSWQGEPGVVDMRFDPSSGEFKVDTYRYDGNEEYMTKSEFAFVRNGVHARYFNFFEFERLGPPIRRGWSCGKFTSETGAIPKTLSATISIEGEKNCRTQRGYRIEKWKVRKFKYKFGSREWKHKYLETGGAVYEGEAIDKQESILIEIALSPTSTSKEKRNALAELAQYRDNVLPQRGFKRFAKWYKGKKSL